MVKIRFVVALLMAMCSFNSMAKPNIEENTQAGIKDQLVIKWEQLLQKEDCNSHIFFDNYKLNKKYIKNNSEGENKESIQSFYKINDYCFTYCIGNYFYYNNQEVFSKEKQILKHLPKINLNDTTINEILNSNQFNKIVDYHYFLKFLKKDNSILNAKGGFYANTSMETISNSSDYKKLKSVFSLKNESVKEYYLNQIKRIFRFNGYVKILEVIRPDIENNCLDTKRKKEVLALYDTYYHLSEGMPAPMFKLPNHKGKEISLSDYKGKLVVIDIWATWCSSCIKKLPKFLELKEMYKDNKNIAFLTISINKFPARLKWKYSLPKYKLMGITNLIAYADKTTFSKDYNITGVPRYFVIDKNGDILNVFGPAPDKNLKSIIDQALAK